MYKQSYNKMTEKEKNQGVAEVNPKSNLAVLLVNWTLTGSMLLFQGRTCIFHEDITELQQRPKNVEQL